VSVAGLIDTKGAWVRVRRATQAQGTDGATRRTWGDAPESRTQVLLEELTAAKAQRIWGAESVARFRATVHACADVQKYDVLRVESGRFIGLTLRVEEDPRGSELGPAIALLGLATTKEAIGI